MWYTRCERLPAITCTSVLTSIGYIVQTSKRVNRHSYYLATAVKKPEALLKAIPFNQFTKHDIKAYRLYLLYTLFRLDGYAKELINSELIQLTAYDKLQA